MIGFNKIVQLQPSRQARSSETPLGVQQPKAVYSTPLKRDAVRPGEKDVTPAKRNMSGYDIPVRRVTQDFVTPARRPFLETQNAPIKKRSLEARDVASHQNQIQGEASFQAANQVVRKRHPRENPAFQGMQKEQYITADTMEEEIHHLDESSENMFDMDDLSDFPANQQGLYNGGFGENLEKPETRNPTTSTKVGFERVNEETVEMGGFVLPGIEKKTIHKSYNWIAGRADGQYRVVLGYNTLFKPKNAVDSTTGEKDNNRWRVVRFENRYKENYPYTEFPAKYLDPLIQALEKAREQHEAEMKEESVI